MYVYTIHRWLRWRQERAWILFLICINICIHTCVCVCVCVCVCIHIYIYICIYICMYMYIYSIHAYIYIYTYIHIYIYMYTLTHSLTHTHSFSLSLSLSHVDVYSNTRVYVLQVGVKGGQRMRKTTTMRIIWWNATISLPILPISSVNTAYRYFQTNEWIN